MFVVSCFYAHTRCIRKSNPQTIYVGIYIISRPFRSGGAAKTTLDWCVAMTNSFVNIERYKRLHSPDPDIYISEKVNEKLMAR